GPLPTTEFCFTFTIEDFVDVTNMQLLNYNEATSEVDYITVNWESVTSEGFEVCGFTCDDFCDAYKDCGSCTTNGKGACGWCNATQSCQQSEYSVYCASYFSESYGTNELEAWLAPSCPPTSQSPYSWRSASQRSF
ncbi:hypothetical protein CYMTET_32821, partial [Cymbomonas tetramitiformis]